uniref:Uncharacterized protein n=1 Tax=Anguilla anguilla TaxID=7936 RepID=A0A0E9PTY7_ANGAN
MGLITGIWVLFCMLKDAIN